MVQNLYLLHLCTYYTIAFPPMSVAVNYLKYTTVHKTVSHCNLTDVYHYKNQTPLLLFYMGLSQ
jgi:hypothetical protein